MASTPAENQHDEQGSEEFERVRGWPLEIMDSLKQRLAQAGHWIFEQSTFFRIHVFSFIFFPLFFSGVFYGCNGRYHIPYLDALFLCYSAMTGTGLATVNLSTLTGFQQAILYVLMLIGTPTTTSWLMILIRRYYILTECTDAYWKKKQRDLDRLLNGKTRSQVLAAIISSPHDPRPVGQPPNIELIKPTPGPTPNPSRGVTILSKQRENDVDEGPNFFHEQPLNSSPKSVQEELPPTSTLSPNIGWADTVSPSHSSMHTNNFRQRRRGYSFLAPSASGAPTRGMTMISMGSHPFSSRVEGIEPKYQGQGGFPGVIDIIKALTRRIAPKTYLKVERSMTIQTAIPVEVGNTENENPIIAGRNSNLRTQSLSDEQIDQVGGLEYRAVTFLCYAIPLYLISTQLIIYLISGPWLAITKQYDNVFEAQPRLVSKTWYSFFLIMSAYSGTGLSLCDTGMLPFQEAYPMIFGTMFCLLAGNHALPVILRFVIWIGYRWTKPGTSRRQTLKFLLDHPRRCYLYLFPSAQTWFLLIVICGLSALEWSSFGILNLGLPVLKALPMAPRVIIGLFQGIAVRASGLPIIPIANIAPALQFLYLVLMYIAVYPVGMCIRSTNVYEEKSLGIFEIPEGDIQEDLDKLEVTEGVGKYLGWHLRQQMAVDVWWLVWGITVILITERGNIINQDKPFLNVFTVTFELVSAFAGIGLSFGFPTDNYSLVGQMRKLSKIVVIIVMIRGRHRGLPVAVDRAVLLPKEYAKDAPFRINSRSGLGVNGMAAPTVHTV